MMRLGDLPRGLANPLERTTSLDVFEERTCLNKKRIGIFCNKSGLNTKATEEVLVCCHGLFFIGGKGIRPGQGEVRENAEHPVHYSTAMVHNLLELGRRRRAILHHQVSLSAQVCRVQETTPETARKFVWGGGLQQ